MRKPKEPTVTKTKHDEMERMLTAKVERVIERAKKAEKELDEERAKVHALQETLLNFFQVVEKKEGVRLIVKLGTRNTGDPLS